MTCGECGCVRDSCKCGSYTEGDFECSQCGAAFNEAQARGGHDFCKPCADTHNGGNVMY